MKKLLLILLTLCLYVSTSFGFAVDRSVTATGTLGSAVTITLLTDGITPHYLNHLKIYKFATTALTLGQLQLFVQQ